MKHSRTALLRACSDIACKDVDPLPPKKRVKMSKKKREWATELCMVFGQALPEEVETEGDLDQHLEPYRHETAADLNGPSNDLQLRLYLNKYDHDSLTHQEIEDFKALSLKGAADVLESRMTKPSKDQETFFRRMVLESHKTPEEAAVLHEYAIRSIANMQDITDGLKATYESRRGRFHYIS